MNEWFIQKNQSSEHEGPLRPSELLARVRSGQVTAETMVRKDDSAWFAAGEVGGLFDAATKTKVEYVYICPHCENQCPKPPTVCRHCDSEVHTAIERKTVVAPDSSAGKPKSVKNWLLKKRIRKKK